MVGGGYIITGSIHLSLEKMSAVGDRTRRSGNTSTDEVGDFYVNTVVRNNHRGGGVIDSSQLTSSNKLLKGKISVLHFYDGG